MSIKSKRFKVRSMTSNEDHHPVAPFSKTDLQSRNTDDKLTTYTLDHKCKFRED